MTHNIRDVEETCKGCYHWLSDDNAYACSNCIITLRTSWLRSEIEKLEEEANDWKTLLNLSPEGQTKREIEMRIETLTSIITRYKEELKVLESK